MCAAPSLSEARKRTMRLLSYEDGLWDLNLGTVFLMLAVYPITRARLGPGWNLALFVGVLAVATVAFAWLRRTISTPRLGYVKAAFTPGRKLLVASLAAAVALTAGLVVLTLVSPGTLGLPGPAVSLTNVWSYGVELAVLGVLIVLFSALGFLFGVPRLFLYGWLLGGANLLSVLLYRGTPDGFNLPLGIAAGVILLIGGSLLVRMLRKYPAREAEA